MPAKKEKTKQKDFAMRVTESKCLFAPTVHSLNVRCNRKMRMRYEIKNRN